MNELEKIDAIYKYLKSEGFILPFSAIKEEFKINEFELRNFLNRLVEDKYVIKIIHEEVGEGYSINIAHPDMEGYKKRYEGQLKESWAKRSPFTFELLKLLLAAIVGGIATAIALRITK